MREIEKIRGKYMTFTTEQLGYFIALRYGLTFFSVIDEDEVCEVVV